MIPKIIKLGYKGEINARKMVIDVSDELAKWAGTVPTIMNRRPSGAEFYPTTSTLDGNTLTWFFSESDLSESGKGEAYIKFCNADGTLVGKTRIIETIISRSGDETEEVPPPVKEWSDKVASDVAKVQLAIDDFKAGIEQGRYKGDDDISPLARVEQTADGADITVVDKDGITTAHIKNGKDGAGSEVTAEAIENALGYTPANADNIPDISGKQDTIADLDAIRDGASKGATALQQHQDLTPITNDVSKLKQDITAKADKSEIPDVPVKSVKVAGSALTPDADGAVDVPTATATQFGIVRVRDYSDGLYISGSNNLSIFPASETNITNRDGNPRGFKPSTTNHLVKASLTDSNRMTLTDAEKAVACETIGAEKPYRKIRTVRITEQGINNIGIDSDENGEPFNVSCIDIYGFVPNSGSGNTISYALNVLQTDTTGGYNIIKTTVSNSSVHVHIEKRTYWHAHAEVANGGENATQVAGNAYVSNRGASGIRSAEWETVSRLAIACANPFAIGTNFDIYAR